MTLLGPLPPVAGVFKIEVTGTTNGIAFANIFHGAYSGAPFSAPNAELIAQKYHAMWRENFLPQCCPQVSLMTTFCTDLSSSTGASASYTSLGPGTFASEPAPNNVATVISWQISRRYRGGHPRTYLPGTPQSMVDSGTSLDPTFVGNLDSAAANFLSESTLSGAIPVPLTGLVCVHYRKGTGYLVPPLVDPITGTAARVLVGSQRKRLV